MDEHVIKTILEWKKIEEETPKTGVTVLVSYGSFLKVLSLFDEGGTRYWFDEGKDFYSVHDKQDWAYIKRPEMIYSDLSYKMLEEMKEKDAR